MQGDAVPLTPCQRGDPFGISVVVNWTVVIPKTA